MSYTPKIDQLLSVATDLGFTEQDFADLALAAADQSGATLAEQTRVATTLGILMWEAREQAPSKRVLSDDLYPPGWPRCPSCGDHALDGHLTCGRIECGEAKHR